MRTRLTHSLEVSSVARGLVRKVCTDFLGAKLRAGQDRHIEAIAATCGLIHDLGNPPFGHSGEDAIREWFKRTFKADELHGMLDGREELVQDFLQFEGNAQTLRIVAKLQVLADFHGLNLTCGALSALCKYTASSVEAGNGGDHGKSKPGYFTSEADLVGNIREKTGTGHARNPITFLVEAADDIVYSVADIEDGVKKRILSWGQLQQLLEQGSEAAAPAVKEVLAWKAEILKPSSTPDDLPHDIHAAAFRTASISLLVREASAAFRHHYDAIMAGEYKGELVATGPAAPFVKLLKTIGRAHIYATHSNLKLELLGRKVIQDLMSLFWQGARELPPDGTIKAKQFPGKLQALLSDAYRKVFQHFAKERADLPLDYHRLLLVTDYVCGMTDSFAKRLHSELTNG
ncbi:Deoxyguanosinetriphosphate triphosphohydrolase [Fimbriiglobus ruber]|uniref:Deoxyguanosinetriphosphate triphosphohydrolase n=1 Tax=Fimbriiglobus ruber TaxID=1908690 RepID=A0A225DPK1_9BACT|nr:Deoxyguanosinetriphosphate triphosphohydrolase [Fimbriiglobus ruber]